MFVSDRQYRNAWNFVLDYFIASRRRLPDLEEEAKEIKEAIDQYNRTCSPTGE